MSKGDKPEPAPMNKTQGDHGGNRSGASKDADKDKQSSQAAGKDPHRGEK
jgi:hypothetical protein